MPDTDPTDFDPKVFDEALWFEVLGLQDHDVEATNAWFVRSNPDIGGMTPNQFMQDRGVEGSNYLHERVLRYRRAKEDEKRLRKFVHPDTHHE